MEPGKNRYSAAEAWPRAGGTVLPSEGTIQKEAASNLALEATRLNLEPGRALQTCHEASESYNRVGNMLLTATMIGLDNDCHGDGERLETRNLSERSGWAVRDSVGCGRDSGGGGRVPGPGQS
eukprot:757919-Hanusia_phi.AAC.9